MRAFPPRNFWIAATIAWVAVGPACSRQEARPGAAAAGPPKPVSVEAVTVSFREAQRLLEVTGTLQPHDKVTVSSQVEGPIRDVLVDLGDLVTQGQLLARVEFEEFQIDVRLQRARLQTAMAQLGLREGQDHRLIATEDTPEVRRARSLLVEAKTNLDRMEALLKDKIGTQQSVDHALAQWRTAEENLNLAKEGVEMQRAQVEQARAALQLADKNLRDASIAAPFAGSISERHVSSGQYVRAQTPLFTIVQTHPLRLRVEVSERLAPAVRPDRPVEIRVDGLPGRTFPGRISRISPAVSEQSRTLLVEALAPNEAGLLRPGMFARASIQSGEMARALMIPARAVLNFYGVNKVYCLQDGKAQDRTVKLGDRFEEYFEVLEGLRDHEVVAVTSLERLSAGAPVEVRRAEAGKR